MDNLSIAKRLLEHATYLEGRDANIYRVRAYRQAADTIMGLTQPVVDLLDKRGRQGLEELPGIASHLSYAIESLVRTGELRTLNGEDGHIDPEQLLTSLPGVGPRLARRIHDELGISSLEEIEQAAHDGRLSKVLVGSKRLRGIIDALAGRLSRYRLPEPLRGEPTVADLLAIDADYRKGVEHGELPTISPRRFNPHNEPWLPLFSQSRRGWSYRARYSNTALAHRLGKTHDWVVVFFDDGIISGQRTMVNYAANGWCAGGSGSAGPIISQK
jgi:DNA polymerase (family 10)